MYGKSSATSNSHHKRVLEEIWSVHHVPSGIWPWFSNWSSSIILGSWQPLLRRIWHTRFAFHVGLKKEKKTLYSSSVSGLPGFEDKELWIAGVKKIGNPKGKQHKKVHILIGGENRTEQCSDILLISINSEEHWHQPPIFQQNWWAKNKLVYW